MSKLPDLEGLATLAYVVEHRSLAAAAREMGVSVATVSRAVARLEERLGARLFNRTSRQISLTAFGESVVEPAMKLLRLAEEAEQTARDLSAAPRGLIRLAAPMTFGQRWVAPVLPDFFRAYPNVQIDLHLSDSVIDLVAEGFDAALRIASLPDSSLVARRLCPMGQFLVASPRYVAEHGPPTHPRELNERNCLGYAYRARGDVWRLSHAELGEQAITPRGSLRVTNVEALIPMVLEGLAIAELPEFIAAEFLRDGRMERLLPDWSLPGGGLYFVTPTARGRPAKVEALADFLAKRLSKSSWR